MNAGSWEAVTMMKQAEPGLIDLSISTWQIIIGSRVILLISGYLRKAHHTEGISGIEGECFLELDTWRYCHLKKSREGRLHAGGQLVTDCQTICKEGAKIADVLLLPAHGEFPQEIPSLPVSLES